MNGLNSTATQLLDDTAVYRRTVAGQLELFDRRARLSQLERRFLSVVTGYTPLRVLLNMGLDEQGVGEAILALVDRRLINLENPEAQWTASLGQHQTRRQLKASGAASAAAAALTHFKLGCIPQLGQKASRDPSVSRACSRTAEAAVAQPTSGGVW